MTDPKVLKKYINMLYTYKKPPFLFWNCALCDVFHTPKSCRLLGSGFPSRFINHNHFLFVPANHGNVFKKFSVFYIGFLTLLTEQWPQLARWTCLRSLEGNAQAFPVFVFVFSFQFPFPVKTVRAVCVLSLFTATSSIEGLKLSNCRACGHKM